MDQPQPEEEPVNSSIVNASADSNDPKVGEGEVNQQIIVNKIILKFDSVLKGNGSGMDIISDFLFNNAGKIFGPILPPLMQLDKVVEKIAPQLLALKPPSATPLLIDFPTVEKRAWGDSSDMGNGGSAIVLRPTNIAPVFDFEFLAETDSTEQRVSPRSSATVPLVSAKPPKRKYRKKQGPPTVDWSVRRSMVKNNGFKHTTLQDSRAPVSKKGR
jgi:hypothetical protein